MDFFKFMDGNLGVDLGGVEIAVAEDGLDEADVGTIF